jgi:hypothetical protein
MSPSARDWRLYADDILDACGKVRRYVAGMSSSSLRPFAMIGFSTESGAFCPACIASTTPMTGEHLSHACRANRQPVPDGMHEAILELEKKRIGPTKSANHLRITVAMVLRVISGDADNDRTCPACEAATSQYVLGGELVPLYAADGDLAEEACMYCGHNLLELARERSESFTHGFQVEHLIDRHGHPALRFDRRPPAHILQALHASGWRRDPLDRVWVDFSTAANVPVAVPSAPVRARVRPPVVRRQSSDPRPSGLSRR